MLPESPPTSKGLRDYYALRGCRSFVDFFKAAAVRCIANQVPETMKNSGLLIGKGIVCKEFLTA